MTPIMTRILAIAALCCIGAVPPAALADGPDDGKGRYTMQPVEGGLLRLDTRTGAMALCTKTSEQWLCDAIEDRSKTAAEQIAKLEAENLDLKNRVKGLEDSATSKDPSQPPGGAGDKMQLPTEQEVDKALDFLERMFKKFRDRLQKIEPNQPAPKTEGDGAL